ncbi:MAG: hypothetical protein NXI24_19635 [bacterium]|nr:hypothetical protein [bacterium]
MSSTSKSIYSRARGDEKHQRLDITIQEAGPGGLRMKVDAEMNEVGILFRLCAVLYSYHWNIQGARIYTPGPNAISDEFHIVTGEDPTAMNEDSMRGLIDDLERLLFGGVSVLEYLTEHHARVPAKERESSEGGGDVVLLKQGQQSVIEVTAVDRPGLLLSLSQAFYLMDINISEGEITTQPDGAVWNRFAVDPADKRFQSPEFQRRLREELKVLF